MSELAMAGPEGLPPQLPPVHPPAEAMPSVWEDIVLSAKKTGAAVTAFAQLVAPLGPPPTQPEFPGHVVTVNSRPLPLPGRFTIRCPETQPEAIVFADQLLSEGENPRYRTLWNNAAFQGSMNGLKNGPLEDYSSKRARRTYKHELADELGLHVFDIPDKTLENDIFPTDHNVKPGSLPFSEYYSRAKAFLAQYDIELEIGEQGKAYAWNNVGPTPEQLDTIATKESLFYLMEFLADLPKEFVDLIGVRSIMLTATAPTIPKGGVLAAGMADMGPVPRRVKINISGTRTAAVYGHEFGHAMNAALCGPKGAKNDSQFVALNDGRPYDAAYRPDIIDPHDDTQIGDLTAAAWQAHKSGDTKLEEQLKQQIEELKAKATFVSGAYNLPEDLAETGGRLTKTQIEYALALDDEMPLTEGKFILLFARLAQYSPKLAVFFARYSRHGEHEFGLNPVVQRALDAVDNRTTR